MINAFVKILFCYDVGKGQHFVNKGLEFRHEFRVALDLAHESCLRKCGLKVIDDEFRLIIFFKMNCLLRGLFGGQSSL